MAAAAFEVISLRCAPAKIALPQHRLTRSGLVGLMTQASFKLGTLPFTLGGLSKIAVFLRIRSLAMSHLEPDLPSTKV